MPESSDQSNRQPESQPTPAADDRQNEEFVRRFAETNHRIYAFVSTLVPHRADADEVFQQTSIVLWRKFGEFDPATDFVAWACRVAQFEVLNFRRVERRRPVTFDDALLATLADERSAAEPVLSRRGEALHNCLDELPADDRRLVEQCYADNAKINKVADQLGRSVHTLYKHLTRIRKWLGDCIDRRLAEEDDS